MYDPYLIVGRKYKAYRIGEADPNKYEFIGTYQGKGMLFSKFTDATLYSGERTTLVEEYAPHFYFQEITTGGKRKRKTRRSTRRRRTTRRR